MVKDRIFINGYGHWTLIGPTWHLIVKMAIMLTSQAKNKITVILEADQIAQMTFCFLTDAYLLKAVRAPDSRPWAM